jgi:hypothetical protein
MEDVRAFSPSKSLLQEALVRDLDPRTHQGGDVVFDFSIRVRHAATSDDVEDASRRWNGSSGKNSAAGKHCHSRQSLTQNALYDCEHMVFNP